MYLTSINEIVTNKNEEVEYFFFLGDVRKLPNASLFMAQNKHLAI